MVGMSGAPVQITRGTRASRITAVLAGFAVAGLALAPLWGSSADLSLLTQFYAYLALATLWNLLAGFSGLVSVGQQAYVGLGGYLIFSLALFLGVNPILAVDQPEALGLRLADDLRGQGAAEILASLGH